MGRKKTYDLNQVLLNMGTIFVEKGFEATSLDDLEKGTGILRGSLYREFGSKRTMFELALKKYLEVDNDMETTLDLLLIGFQELAARDKKISALLLTWYHSFSKPEQTVAQLLGSHLIKRSEILNESSD